MGKLQAKAPGLEHRVHLADLSSMAETRRIGAAIAASEPRVDVLVNNAGAMFGERPPADRPIILGERNQRHEPRFPTPGRFERLRHRQLLLEGARRIDKKKDAAGRRAGGGR